MLRLLSTLAGLLVITPFAFATTFDFEAQGAVRDQDDLDTAWANGRLLNKTLAALSPGDTLIFPNATYHIMGGIKSDGLSDVTISFDGSLIFSDDIDEWPKVREDWPIPPSHPPHPLNPLAQNENGDVFPSLYFSNPTNVKFTSSGKGTLDGRGKKWWGLPGIGYLRRGENRPRLFEVESGTNILVENIFFKNSAYWTFWVHSVQGLEVRFCDIEAR